MINLLSNLKISVPDKIFIKDPESSELGKRIIEHSILLLKNLVKKLVQMKVRFIAILKVSINCYFI